MPIAKLSASEAIDRVKSNPNAHWPKRGGANRLSPMAKPAFSPSFALPKGGTIFTIGSCFARNVERALKERGFNLPALDVLDNDEDFASVGSKVLNNFGAPSICNEIKWAFEDNTNEEACFMPTGNGYVDLHVDNTLRPAALDKVQQRREALRTAYRSISECDAVIITLGLSEVWFDTKTGYYLNMAPRRSMMREDPDRFELHVLGYEETIANLREAMELIQTNGRKDVRVVLTVSPIPLKATHRDVDVMVANTYSKSVLRTAAEEIALTYDFVDYFPSFESITLTDRSVAYKEDEIHVTQDIIDLNVGRMVEAYTGLGRISEDEIRSNLDMYRARPKIGFEALTQNTDLCADPEIAAVLTECATAVDRLDVAELALTLAEDPSGILEAMLYFGQNEPAAALAAISHKPEDARHLARYFMLRIRANVDTFRVDEAIDAAEEWSATTPNSPVPFKILAKSLAGQNDPRAEDWYARAIEVSGGNTGIILDMADFLVRRGKADAARTRLAEITQASDQEERRKTRLLHAI